LAEPYLLEVTGDAERAARWWLDRECRYEAALVLASSGNVQALHRALDLLRELGTLPAVAVVAKRLRALGEQRVPRGPRPGTSANSLGLTQREADVLELLTTGLSNAEIATRLVVSVRTIDHHVSAILRKLGVRSRSAAIAETARLRRVGLL
jgi:DNA-binding NarL/FixJ family response regulator